MKAIIQIKALNFLMEEMNLMTIKMIVEESFKISKVKVPPYTIQQK
jgi:hypothetical protein